MWGTRDGESLRTIGPKRLIRGKEEDDYEEDHGDELGCVSSTTLRDFLGGWLENAPCTVGGLHFLPLWLESKKVGHNVTGIIKGYRASERSKEVVCGW